MKVWATVGYFDQVGDGAVFELDSYTGSIEEVFRFTPPAHLRVPQKGFTGACWTDAPGDDQLLVCGAAAVYRFDGRSLAPSGVLTLPSFNDLHGVSVSDGRIFVANTGLDCIDVFAVDGGFLGSHSFDAAWVSASRQRGEAPGRDDWPRLAQAGWSGGPSGLTPLRPDDHYYQDDQLQPFRQRKVRDYVHPNHVVAHGGRILVTSLTQRAVVDVASWQTAFHTDGPPHDGQIEAGAFWTTCVDGQVEAHPFGADGSPARYDVSDSTGVTGWCRGLHLTEELMFVGFTEIRRPPGHRWSRGDYSLTTTSVVCLDRTTKLEVARFDLTHPDRHSKVFAIIEAP